MGGGDSYISYVTNAPSGFLARSRNAPSVPKKNPTEP